MQRWVAWLAGINVGGRRVTNDALAAPFSTLGAEHVETYQASGNVVFDRDGNEVDLTAQVEQVLREALGFEVATFLRTAEQVREVTVVEPFAPDVVEASTGKLQVVFLRSAPSRAQAREVAEQQTDDDRLRVVGRELYWLPARGVGRSELDWRALAPHVGTSTTVRTHGTVCRLAAKFLHG